MQPPPKKKRKSEGGQQKRPKAAAASQEDVHPVAQAVQAVVAVEPTGWEELDGQAQDVQQQAGECLCGEVEKPSNSQYSTPNRAAARTGGHACCSPPAAAAPPPDAS